MKTIVKQIASGTFIALLLLVGNVKADATEIIVTSQETVETTLQVENRMTNETVWNTNSLNITEFVQETEAELELESWMTNAESWNLNNNFGVELEAEMQLQDWMTDDNTWNTENQDTEAELTVEDWMTNSEVWK